MVGDCGGVGERGLLRISAEWKGDAAVTGGVRLWPGTKVCGGGAGGWLSRPWTDGDGARSELAGERERFGGCFIGEPGVGAGGGMHRDVTPLTVRSE